MLTYLKLLITMALWGGTLLPAGFWPVMFPLLLRRLSALSLLGCFYRFCYIGLKGLPRLNRRQLGFVLLLGLTGVFGYNIAFLRGWRRFRRGVPV